MESKFSRKCLHWYFSYFLFSVLRSRKIFGVLIIKQKKKNIKSNERKNLNAVQPSFSFFLNIWSADQLEMLSENKCLAERIVTKTNQEMKFFDKTWYLKNCKNKSIANKRRLDSIYLNEIMLKMSSLFKSR